MIAWVAALVALLLTVRLGVIIEESATNRIKLHELEMNYLAQLTRELLAVQSERRNQ